MSRFLSSAYRTLTPYTPGEQPQDKKYIKLNTNESPFPPAPGVIAAVNASEAMDLRLYSDPELKPLKAQLSESFQVDVSEVFVGNGSDECLNYAFMAFGEDGFAFPDITYSFYKVIAQLNQVTTEVKPLRADFMIDLADYLGPETADGGHAGIGKNIVIPNPNAPTGIPISLDAIAALCEANADHVVMIDEAYVDFGGVSALPLVDKYENLLIVQTFSKSRALAGMRIGFAIGQKKLISYLNDVKFSFNSYTMNRLTIACGKACVEDRGYFQEITGKIVATREWTKQKLAELGFTFPDSKANFIFATHKTVPAQELFENLKTAGIYVRYFKKPRIDNYLRITVGTQAEMERLVEVLAELVK